MARTSHPGSAALAVFVALPHLGKGIAVGLTPLGGPLAQARLARGRPRVHLAVMGRTSTVRTKALQYGQILLGTMAAGDRWNKWNYCLPKPYGQ